MIHEVNIVLKALQNIGLRVVYIFNEYGKDGYYIVYTEFNYVDNMTNKLDVKGKDITDIILKGTFIINVNNEATFKDQVFTALGGVKDMRMEFSHHWKWINFVSVH